MRTRSLHEPGVGTPWPPWGPGPARPRLNCSVTNVIPSQLELICPPEQQLQELPPNCRFPQYLLTQACPPGVSCSPWPSF